MNNNDKNNELTYNQAKALLGKMYSSNQEGNNVEYSEELAKKNNSNNEQSRIVKTAANKDNNVKKIDD